MFFRLAGSYQLTMQFLNILHIKNRNGMETLLGAYSLPVHVSDRAVIAYK